MNFLEKIKNLVILLKNPIKFGEKSKKGEKLWKI